MGSFVGPDIVDNGLVFAIDAGSERSYPGTGTTVTSLVNSSTVTLENGVSFVTDNGGTWDFDGTDDYIQTNFGQNIVSTGFSVTFFFNVTGSATQFYMQMYVSDDSNTVFRIERNGGGGASSVEFGHSPNGSGGMVELNSNNFPSASDVSFYTGAILRIAARQDGTLLPINGKMPSVKVYNRSLSAAEILQNFNAQRSRFGL